MSVESRDTKRTDERKISREKSKIGHRRINDQGTVTYKRKTTSEIQNALQLGIKVSVTLAHSKSKRDMLLKDFGVVETLSFPKGGGKDTPVHDLPDFTFKTFAPIAFRYFRDFFQVDISDYLNSICHQDLRELSSAGASGSIFYITRDDEFIIKTVQHKEASFLQKLLPEYYINLIQHPRTLLPKFYGLYCYQTMGKNIRFVIMNNLLPSMIRIHEKYDLKGSTYKRLAGPEERTKSAPTLKDLDFRERHRDGLLLEVDTYEALLSTIQRDCRVLESFRIMDYSLLLGVHNLDENLRTTANTGVSASTGSTGENPPTRDQIRSAPETSNRTQSDISLTQSGDDYFMPCGAAVPAVETGVPVHGKCELEEVESTTEPPTRNSISQLPGSQVHIPNAESGFREFLARWTPDSRQVKSFITGTAGACLSQTVQALWTGNCDVELYSCVAPLAVLSAGSSDSSVSSDFLSTELDDSYDSSRPVSNSLKEFARAHRRSSLGDSIRSLGMLTQANQSYMAKGRATENHQSIVTKGVPLSTSPGDTTATERKPAPPSPVPVPVTVPTPTGAPVAVSTVATTAVTRHKTRSRSTRRIAAYSTMLESIQAPVEQVELQGGDEEYIPTGGIPARNSGGDRLILYMGIIDILQSYQIIKKMEHNLKAMFLDASTISVTDPRFYAQRFQDFFANIVFRKIPSLDQPQILSGMHVRRFRNFVHMAMRQNPERKPSSSRREMSDKGKPAIPLSGTSTDINDNKSKVDNQPSVTRHTTQLVSSDNKVTKQVDLPH